MKLIGIDTQHLHKIHYKKDDEKHGRYFSMVFVGTVEGICSDAKKGLKYFDEVELCIDIDINKFCTCFGNFTSSGDTVKGYMDGEDLLKVLKLVKKLKSR